MTDDLPLFQPTPLQRRIIDAAVEIEECTPDTIEFLHAVLCQVGLPRSSTKERIFERNNGKASIRVESGALYKGGKWIEQQLPYGAKPRLALIHTSSEAVRTRSRTVEVGESIAEFLRLLDLPTTGAAYGEMKRQIERLAACNMMLGMSAPSRDVTVSAKPIERFEAWLQYDGKQRSMWPGVLELSQPFFETLMAHAVPLDPRAIHGLKKSALALDAYTWLAHRLCRVRKPVGVKLSWGNLRQQFGQEYRCSKDFKKEFRAALLKVRVVYPSARIDEEIGGIRLFASPAPVPKSQVVVRLPGKTAISG
jgi:replication initiator protein